MSHMRVDKNIKTDAENQREMVEKLQREQERAEAEYKRRHGGEAALAPEAVRERIHLGQSRTQAAGDRESVDRTHIYTSPSEEVKKESEGIKRAYQEQSKALETLGQSLGAVKRDSQGG